MRPARGCANESAFVRYTVYTKLQCVAPETVFQNAGSELRSSSTLRSRHVLSGLDLQEQLNRQSAKGAFDFSRSCQALKSRQRDRHLTRR